MVMRLNTTVIVGDEKMGEKEEKLAGIAGYIPVYEKEEDAIEASCKGKFDIVLIMV